MTDTRGAPPRVGVGQPPVDVELHRHGRRIGFAWTEVAARLLARHPELAGALGLDAWPENGYPVLGFDANEMLPILRGVPDGAGPDGVVAAIGPVTFDPDAA